jgi:ABC-type uncharacterized transport system YnjBCD ATPase subunit
MRYGAVTAVDNINFTIEAGKLVTLLGPPAAARPRPAHDRRAWIASEADPDRRART